MSKLICFGNKITIKKECIVSFILTDGNEVNWGCEKTLQINCIDNIIHKIAFDNEEDALKTVIELRKQLEE